MYKRFILLHNIKTFFKWQRIVNMLVVSAALVFGSFIGILQVSPLRADESSIKFQDMMSNIRRWSIPRPMGSESIAYVRSGIISEIEEMGLEPIIRRFDFTENEIIEARNFLRGRDVGRHLPQRFREQYLSTGYLQIYNILTRFTSYNSDRVVLIVSHYDSVPNSPGAGDAMLPITAMIEAIRHLSLMDNPAINIYFLMTDAEEYWAMGALAFIRDNPELLDRIGMVVNLEATGNSGGLTLFQTSPQPGEMIRLFGRAVPRPIGFSIGNPLYDALGFWTDFCMFLHYDLPGVNLAILGGHSTYYHMPADTYYNLCRNAAYNYLRTVLAFTDYFAENALDTLRQSSTDVVFFPFMPGNLVIMSYFKSYIAGIIICILALTYIILNIRTKKGKKALCFLAGLILLSVLGMLYFHYSGYLFWTLLLAVLTVTYFSKIPIYGNIVKFVFIVTIPMIWIPLPVMAFELVFVRLL